MQNSGYTLLFGKKSYIFHPSPAIIILPKSMMDMFQVKEKISNGKSTLEEQVVLKYNFQIWQFSSAGGYSALHMLREVPRGFLFFLCSYTITSCMGLAK